MDNSTQQWARADADGFCVEIIDFDPTGRFHQSIVFHPVQPEYVGWIDYKYQWNGEYWDEPEKGYTLAKILKAKEAEFTNNIQQRLDDFAQTRGYDGILSAASYAASQNPRFAAEGQYAVQARDDTWAKAYELLAEYVDSGTIPEWGEIAARLPKLEWPV